VRVVRRSPLSHGYWAKRLNAHVDTIRAARKGQTWKHVTS
jgi:hypothetical protein